MKSISFKDLSKIGLLKSVKQELARKKIVDNFDLPSNEMKDILYKKWYKLNNINSKNDLKIWLTNNELDIEELDELVIKKWKWENWCALKFKSEIPSYFLKRKDQIDTVCYSLIRVKNKEFADELYLRIKDDKADFSELSRKYSEGIEKNSGGFIGPLPIDNAHPEIAKLLKISFENQLWPPINLDNWWIILKIEKKNNIKLDPNLEMKLALELGENYLKNNNGDILN